MVAVVGRLCRLARAGVVDLGLGLASCREQTTEHNLAVGLVLDADFLGLDSWPSDHDGGVHLYVMARRVQYLAPPNVQRPQSL